MKKILLVVVLCVLAFPTMASHIVGGEFEIIHLSDNNYRINLILYFDVLEGNPGARDPDVSARIFRKRNNSAVRNVLLTLRDDTRVEYTQPDCSHGEIITSRLVYSTEIQMTPLQYGDAEGYYIAWERCCRNYTISNVISNDPSQGQYAGQTFYLEFPPVVKDGEPFINSSPRLFPPLNDYACPNRPYYVDFAGVDDDGDSLAYSVVTPLNTHTGEAIPTGGPGSQPYPTVLYRPPFSPLNILNGQPDLSISSNGFITVTPTTQGLFVFAVKCEEFREGIKIGEVRRDFQMLVVDQCPAAEPPVIEGKIITAPDNAFTANSLSVAFNNTVDDDNRCIQVRISDPDAAKQEENFQEKVKIKAIPLNFKTDISEILPDISSGTLINGDTKVFDICFPKCPYKIGSFDIAIVAMDDACSLPLTDTLFVTVTVTPPPNNPPYFTTPDVSTVVLEGNTLTWPVQIKDDDGDQLIVGPVPIGFQPDLAGMTFEILDQQNGLVNAQFTWDARCDVYDFTQRTNFEYWVFADDIDECLLATPDIMKFNLGLLLPGNSDPIIDSDLTTNPYERREERITQPFQTFTFNVTGNDADNDLLVLDVKGKGFNLSDYGIQFEPVTGNGAVNSTFQWNIQCDLINLNIKNQFEFEFVVVDNQNKCRFFNTDTLDVLLTIEPPTNLKPELNVVSLNAVHQLQGGSMDVILGEQINLGISAIDLDTNPQRDLIKIELYEINGTPLPQDYVFAPAEGMGSAETTFSWNPECHIFTDESRRNEYDFTFLVYDNRCFNVLADTVTVTINISDVNANNEAFVPPNFISPNGDDCNDYFAMEGYESTCGNVIPVNLPPDNCDGEFKSIRIFNRWGGLVYQSSHRDFRWYAQGEPNGVYFYYLNYSDKEYKGSITVRY